MDRSENPEADAARQLQARGYGWTFTTRHVGSAITSARCNIERLAKKAISNRQRLAAVFGKPRSLR